MVGDVGDWVTVTRKAWETKDDEIARLREEFEAVTLLATNLAKSLTNTQFERDELREQNAKLQSTIERVEAVLVKIAEQPNMRPMDIYGLLEGALDHNYKPLSGSDTAESKA